MVESKDTNMSFSTGKSIAGRDIALENAEYPVTYSEQEGDNEAEVLPVT